MSISTLILGRITQLTSGAGSSIDHLLVMTFLATVFRFTDRFGAKAAEQASRLRRATVFMIIVEVQSIQTISDGVIVSLDLSRDLLLLPCDDTQ